MTRIYSIRDSFYPDSKIIVWGASRFGDGHDMEMQEFILKTSGTKPGDGTCLCVGFAPDEPKMKSPEAVQAQRIRNMQKRAAREPLFADQIEAKELKKDYFHIETARQHQARRLQVHKDYEKRFWQEHAPEKEIKLPNKSLDQTARSERP